MHALSNQDLYKYIKIIYCFRSFSVKVATNFTNNSIFTPQSFYPIERTKANSNVARGCKVREAFPARDGMRSEATDGKEGKRGSNKILLPRNRPIIVTARFDRVKHIVNVERDEPPGRQELLLTPLTAALCRIILLRLRPASFFPYNVCAYKILRYPWVRKHQ